MKNLVRFGLVLVCQLIAWQSVSAEPWSRFRGPNGTGVSQVAGIPTRWSAADYSWQRELPGEGHSSPVIWGDKLFVTSANEESGERWLLCLRASDGTTLWQQNFGFKPYRKHRNNSFATSTPAVDETGVYCVWQSRDEAFVCGMTLEGKERWRFSLGSFQGGHGGAVSPIVHDGRVIVGNDHEGESSLLALDAVTGESVWQVPRNSKRATYSTPCIYERPVPGADPVTEVIFTDWTHGITAIDFQSGKVNWEITPFGEDKERAIGSPIVVGDLIIGTCGFVTAKRHAVAVKPVLRGEKLEVEEIYRIERQVPHVPTVLAHNGLLFLWSESGILSCFDVVSGELHYQKRVGGNFSGSPVCLNGFLYCVNDEGVVVVVQAAAEYQEVARNELGEPSRATPAAANGRLYLRTVSHLFCLGQP